ncbi:hypothetical protein NG796_18235 [Laspinema sp. A4]|uniref:hypothetical protein n=1 Tax=Laspinema sp. D2d TaxID=2953686 RepID=UPI0021BAED97|nr:hypothetical protein [Laspinema sp. D2d]MCT7985216.1 hypothetical protein [Laspinema sp. D2d]
MNEAETPAELIHPALKAPLWRLIPDSGIGRARIVADRRIGHRKRAQPKGADMW